jgi:diguanylate cyclase (GGDEF)-like protein
MCPMFDEPAETLNLRQLRVARGGDTDVVPVPKARVVQNRTANLVQIGPPGPGLGRRFSFGLNTITLGRDAHCSLPIPDGSVSRMHTVIEPRSDGTYHLSDLNSRNGTYVNGKKVSESLLNDGDYVQLGQCVFRFLAGGNVEAGYHEEIHRLTLLDPLTGAHNRRSLAEYLDREIERAGRHSRPIAVLMIDVDHFRQVNERHGHPGGDLVLRELAARLRNLARLEDLVCRYGGEEFAVALPETDLPGASVAGERYRRAVAGNFFIVDDESFAVTVSVGAAAIHPGETKSASELLKTADARMYDAKRAGRNRVCPVLPGGLDHIPEIVDTPTMGGQTREIQL